MKLEYLEEFLHLAEIGSYTAAAERLFLSESTLSRHMMALEKELGARLFIREPRGVSLSKEGALLISYARRVTGLLEEYNGLLSEGARTQKKLTVGFVRAVTQYGIMSHLLRFRRENPDITLLLTENKPGTLWQMVRRRECNFALCYKYAFLDPYDLEVTTLIEDRVTVAFPPGHPLGNKKEVAIRDLKDEHYILPTRSNTMHAICERLFHEAGYTPMVAAYSENSCDMLEMVAHGVGITLLEKVRFQHSCPPGVQMVDLAPPMRKDVVLLSQAKKLDRTEEYFLGYITERVRSAL